MQSLPSQSLLLSRFKGYAWRIAACGQCHQHLGWRFEPNVHISGVETRPDPSATGRGASAPFTAFILDRIAVQTVIQTGLTSSRVNSWTAKNLTSM